MLTNGDCKKMMDYFIQALKQDAELQAVMANALRKSVKPCKQLISAKAAAKLAGISVWQLYRIKDDECGKPRFSYIKTGHTKSSTLRFNANTFMDEYQRYVSSRQ